MRLFLCLKKMRENKLPDPNVFLVKAVGSGMGSSIAVIFTDDSKINIFKRWIVGLIAGFVSAPFIIDHFEWQHSLDYWLASATLGGLMGYLVIETIFTSGIKDILKKRLKP